MKKKISLLICMIAAAFCFTACGNKQSAQYDEEQLAQVADFLIGYCAEADEMALMQWDELSEFAINLQLTEAGLPFEAESFLSVLDSWKAGIAECGGYMEHGDYSFKVTNGKVEVSTEAKFENRDAVISFMFDSESKLESMDVSANMETGEILEKAGLNTVLGMGTVFAVLILIAFIISLFKFIPAIQAAFSKKPAQEQKEESKEAAPLAAAAPVIEAEDVDDGELIAVISAAIAAAQAEAQVGTDGFFVRSIRRRPSNKWNSK